MSEVKRLKGIPDGDELLDRVGPLELAAHDFRITLTEDRLNRDHVNTERIAVETHRQAGVEVRNVMQRDKGKNPEDLPTAPSIKALVRRHRRQIASATQELSSPQLMEGE